MSFVVHDLRNPLSVIAANATLCAEDDVSPDTRRSLDDIIVAATTLERMVTDLLDMARAEQTRLAPAVSCVDVEALVRDSLNAGRGPSPTTGASGSTARCPRGSARWSTPSSCAACW